MPSPGSPKQIASPPTRGLDAREPEYLTFSLGAEYGIDVHKIQEIRGYEVPTRIPGAAPWINGVMHLRGAVVPVVDLRARLGMEAVAYGASTVTVVVEADGMTTGLVVDAVHDVARIDPDDIQTPGTELPCLRAGYLAGIATLRADDAERTLMLLDTDRVVLAPAAMHLSATNC